VAVQRIGPLSEGDEAPYFSASDDDNAGWRTDDGAPHDPAASPAQRICDELSDEDGSGSGSSDDDDVAWGPEMATPARGWRGASARRRLHTTAGRARHAAMRRSGSTADEGAQGSAESGDGNPNGRTAAPQLDDGPSADGESGQWVRS
jgi:hypothetical protein